MEVRLCVEKYLPVDLNSLSLNSKRQPKSKPAHRCVSRRAAQSSPVFRATFFNPGSTIVIPGSTRQVSPDVGASRTARSKKPLLEQTAYNRAIRHPIIKMGWKGTWVRVYGYFKKIAKIPTLFLVSFHSILGFGQTDKRASERASDWVATLASERASERPHQWRNGALHSIAFDWEVKVRRLSELKLGVREPIEEAQHVSSRVAALFDGGYQRVAIVSKMKIGFELRKILEPTAIDIRSTTPLVSPRASLVLTDSLQLTSDSQHLGFRSLRLIEALNSAVTRLGRSCPLLNNASLSCSLQIPNKRYSESELNPRYETKDAVRYARQATGSSWCGIVVLTSGHSGSDSSAVSSPVIMRLDFEIYTAVQDRSQLQGPLGGMCQGASCEILTHSLSRGQAIRYRLYKYHDDDMSDGEQELAHAW
uniref:Uncharacterized protein n=1 Tax=Timema shepardi TaxID=629360 RepID=A0A7R9AQE7_TIMSH|nr:unnamed protein product [Timema shepardi]